MAMNNHGTNAGGPQGYGRPAAPGPGRQDPQGNLHGGQGWWSDTTVRRPRSAPTRGPADPLHPVWDRAPRRGRVLDVLLVLVAALVVGAVLLVLVLAVASTAVARLLL